MKQLLLLPAMLLTSCSTPLALKSPVSLSDTVLTLPDETVAGMSQAGRRDYLERPAGKFDPQARRLHLFGDSPDMGGDAESMWFLRLFEDEQGRTLAASHAARPFADGREPSTADTFIHRLEEGRWVEVTGEVLPANVPRTWWFRFGAAGEPVPCGPYRRFARRDGLGHAYAMDRTAGVLLWEGTRFRFRALD